MRSYAAARATCWQVRIPNALPYFFTALKVGTTLSLIGAIVGEYFGGSTVVLGRFIVQSASALRFDVRGRRSCSRRWPGSSTSSSRLMERVVIPWHVVHPGEDPRTSVRAVRTRYRSRPGTAAGMEMAARGARVMRGCGTDAILAWPLVPRPVRGLFEVSTARPVPVRSRPRPGAGVGAAGSRAPGRPASQWRPSRPVRLQLQWVPQAQFAGYFAAVKQGFLRAEEGLTVEIVPGGPTVVPQQVGSQPDGPEFTISWVPEGPRGPRGGLGPRRHRPDLPALRHPVGLVEGQRHRRHPRRFAGKKVGAWDFGNEFEVTAGLASRPDPGPREQRRSRHAVPEGHPGRSTWSLLLNARSTWPRR